ncbi:MAG: tRNA pseudouridine(55) synthase TruB [Oscillatoriales cyanobacterium C42_A2020_001]|nr:tRNA pseudouridine(55) synthase TruB [Leptolyngbyaceae cyanobacterium C42_A2020_001]
MDGFLNLDKAVGFTSHDCVAKVRRLLKMKRVGHAGTLDPAATGVLPIALGRATRLLQFLPGDKAYLATIRFGITTTTDDLEGAVLTQQPVHDLSLETVQAALRQFHGTIQQIPPNYSAIQVEGKRLYDLAREGKAITAQPRTVEVYQVKILDWRPGDFPEIDVEIACGSGTYIRAIARDLGKLLQTGGTLSALRRTISSGFQLANSLTLEELDATLQTQSFQPIPPEAGVAHLDAIALPDAIARRWCLGQRIAWGEVPTDQIPTAPIRIQHESGLFLGIGQRTGTDETAVLSPQVVLTVFSE